MMIYLQVHYFEKKISEMAELTPKVTRVAKGKVAKPPSPKKTKQSPSMRSNLNQKKQKPGPVIPVREFQDPLYIEVYK
jgi:hypothetical protein